MMKPGTNDEMLEPEKLNDETWKDKDNNLKMMSKAETNEEM